FRAAIVCYCFFFFSSRRRHTRLQGDWSSDVCSSDLELLGELPKLGRPEVLHRPVLRPVEHLGPPQFRQLTEELVEAGFGVDPGRSEERRVGKECGARRGAERQKSTLECEQRYREENQ